MTVGFMIHCCPAVARLYRRRMRVARGSGSVPGRFTICWRDSLRAGTCATRLQASRRGASALRRTIITNASQQYSSGRSRRQANSLGGCVASFILRVSCLRGPRPAAQRSDDACARASATATAAAPTCCWGRNPRRVHTAWKSRIPKHRPCLSCARTVLCGPGGKGICGLARDVRGHGIDRHLRRDPVAQVPKNLWHSAVVELVSAAFRFLQEISFHPR